MRQTYNLRGVLAIAAVSFVVVLLSIVWHSHHAAEATVSDRVNAWPQQPISASTLDKSLRHMQGYGAGAVADFKGCMKVFLSIETVLTFQDLDICKFNAESEHPPRKLFATTKTTSLTALRAAQQAAIDEDTGR